MAKNKFKNLIKRILQKMINVKTNKILDKHILFNNNLKEIKKHSKSKNIFLQDDGEEYLYYDDSMSLELSTKYELFDFDDEGDI